MFLPCRKFCILSQTRRTYIITTLAMLEQETALIAQIVVESTLGERDGVKLNEVLTADLPRGIKAFMTAEVIKLLEPEFRQSQRLVHIAKGLGGTDAAERSLLRTLAAEYTIPREEFLPMVTSAVEFLKEYLCRPQHTLHALLYKASDTATLDDVMRVFEYTVDYAYYGELVMRHARTKGWREISAVQFKDLLARIDEAVVQHHTPRELALLTKPIYDFLLFGDASLTRPIPLRAVLSFYDDKNLDAVKDYVERICAVRGRQHISMNELIDILEDLYVVQTKVQEEVAESEQEIFTHRSGEPSSEGQQPDVAENAETSEPIVAESPRDTGAAEPQTPPPDQEEEPSFIAERRETPREPEARAEEQPKVDVTALPRSELERDIPPLEVHPAPVTNADVLVEYARQRKLQREPFILRFRSRTQPVESIAPPAAPRAVQDIHLAFSEDQRARFIKRIFKGDENYYFIFLSSLKDVQNWRDAQPYLRDLFEMNNLHHLSPDVIEFTDAVHAYFNPELKKTE